MGQDPRQHFPPAFPFVGEHRVKYDPFGRHCQPEGRKLAHHVVVETGYIIVLGVEVFTRGRLVVPVFYALEKKIGVRGKVPNYARSTLFAKRRA